MTTKIALFLMLATALAALAPLGGALAAPDPQGEAELLAAPSGPAAAPAPATRPDRAALPATQPGTRGSPISDLLTRSLPQYLRTRQLLARRELSPTDRRLVEIHSILKASQQTVEAIVLAKRKFDNLPPSVQSRYRERAREIEQVLAELPPEEQAKLLAMTPAERAKRIMELIAQRKARQIRGGAAPAPK